MGNHDCTGDTMGLEQPLTPSKFRKDGTNEWRNKEMFSETGDGNLFPLGQTAAFSPGPEKGKT